VLTKWKVLAGVVVAAVLVASAVLVRIATADSRATPAPSENVADADAANVADACSLLKPADVTTAMRRAPASLRPLRVDAGVVTSRTSGASISRSCALGLLLRDHEGGSVQVLTSPVREGVCPPKATRNRDRATIAGNAVVLVQSGENQHPRAVVFGKNGTCVSLAAVLSNGRSIGPSAYRALAGNALHRL
jgi:hypothetical protein